ncbi:hypothetical protein TTHERM_000094249 (macronuclear) [Tetrahymena thermophila SB210]|uniref:Uncharacterized protein n=1 Tax=Tetrahymena thermophila (strain SB210) TaxID=312017 RepID=W7XKS9_TETTS|nr:hypothetical protein TTHERM_000094249 [Tetrahymena thermophila SB210]EWS75179.1 hypothetical protein TTHERM_000094249 [Tetrahymena thermophila SB210]|eukprot:XP_012652170.1 hypothetical protein TTHERM_000094249 [Tetrahymena thermophila SB210]
MRIYQIFQIQASNQIFQMMKNSLDSFIDNTKLGLEILHLEEQKVKTIRILCQAQEMSNSMHKELALRTVI